MNFISKKSDANNIEKHKFKNLDFDQDVKTEESITIINEDNFEIFNENKKNNNKDKLKIKDITEEEKLRLDFQKKYMKLRFNQNKDFLERMGIDIIIRKNKDKIMDTFVKQSKFKISHEDEINLYNRLIEDANRRLDEFEKNQRLKEEEENNNIELLRKALNKDNKKYNEKEWNKIYNKRFTTFLKSKKKKYLNLISNILKEDLDLSEEEKPKKIDKYKNLNKKELAKIINNNINNLYNDYMLRKQKMINKQNNLELKNKKNKFIFTDKFNKINKLKKNKSSSQNKNKNINIKINNNIFPKDNSRNIINKKKYSFTPKSVNLKSIYKISNDEKKQKQKNYESTGKLISEILINSFFMSHGKYL